MSAEMLGCALEGTAQRFYARLPVPNRYNYEWLAPTRYCSQVPEVQREMLLSRTRKAGESMLDLGDDIWRLVQESYPEMDYNFQELIALDCLKRAVDQELRLRFIDRGVKTLQEVVDIAEVYESVVKWGKPSVANPQRSVRAIQKDAPEGDRKASSRLDKVEQDVGSLKTSMDKLQKTVERFGGPSARPPVRGQPWPNQAPGQNRPDSHSSSGRQSENTHNRGECFRCDGRDHWANECPQRGRILGNGPPPGRAWVVAWWVIMGKEAIGTVKSKE